MLLMWSSSDFFKINFFQKIISGTLSVSNGLDPDRDQFGYELFCKLRFSADDKSGQYLARSCAGFMSCVYHVNHNLIAHKP